MDLTPDTVLKRANGVNIAIDSAHVVQVKVNGRRASFSNLALTLLTVFAEPLTMRQALKKLQVSGAQHWVELTSAVSKLWVLGALYNYEENQFVPDKNFASFGSSPIHITMLNDRVRTEMFFDAIKNTVKEGDVVVDIGTGTGVLAVEAARAGAARVYAIEAGAIADVAQSVFNNSGFADRITLFRGWSTQIELPEKADVLVSEIIGNDPFDENVLQVFVDARKRLLKPGAQIIPRSIRVKGVPVSIPANLLQNRLLQEHDLENWSKWYGSDFSALKNFNPSLARHLIKANAQKVNELTVYDEPIVLAGVDFQTFSEPGVENLVQGKAGKAFNGLLTYFELDLNNKVLSNHPIHTDRNNSWINFVWYLPEALQLKTGEEYTIHYKYAGGRDSEIRLLPHIAKKDI